MKFSLVQCGPDGTPTKPIPHMPDALVANCIATADLYRRIGFVEPWVGFVAVDDDQAVGGGAFVGAPLDNCVEIAYFTLEDKEGRGYATRTVAELIGIARRHHPGIVLKAFTLREHNASTSILQRFGFRVVGDAQDKDAGAVWEWRTDCAPPPVTDA
jgi:[ribosomal protein S5]-alanine N-acetyltransferase